MEMIKPNSKRWFDLTLLDGEQFKPTEIENYAISNYGRLKRLPHSFSFIRRGSEVTMYFKERILKLTKNATGYYTFHHKQTGCFKIHRLVASAFIPNPNGLPSINHKDENPLNNFVYVNDDGTIDAEKSNLEWCTAKYNANYGTNRERISEKMKQIRRKGCKTIKQYTTEGELVAEYKGKEEIEKAGFVYTTVTRSCRHITEISQGYIWRYDDDPFTLAEYHINTDFCKKVVCAYDMDNNLVAKYNGLKEAARMVQGHVSEISQCCNGKRKSAFGFIWKYSTPSS